MIILQFKLFFSILIICLIVDYLWIGVIANNFYIAQFGELARTRPDGKFDVLLWAAIIVYLLIALGLTLFVLPKLSFSDSYFIALGWGFLFGIILYGVYDFTNHVILAKWPPVLLAVDILWGGVLCGILGIAGKFLRDSYFA